MLYYIIEGEKMNIPKFTPLQWAIIAFDFAGWVAVVYFGWHYFNCIC